MGTPPAYEHFPELTSAIPTHKMNSNARRLRYGTDDWNNAAALSNIDKHIQNPTIKEGRITRVVVANPRGSLGSNVHSLSSDDKEDPGLHSTHLDYNHSKQLPPQSSPNGSRKLSMGGIRLGSSVPSAARTSEPGSYTSRAAGSLFKESVPTTYPVNYKVAPKRKTEDNPQDAFQALTQKVNESNKFPAHLRAPSLVVPSRDAERSKNLSRLPPHLRAPSSNVSSENTQSVEPSTSMNAGLKSKSASQDSAYPCSYPDCADGFSRAKDLKRHKAKHHDWCSVCDVDCEDDIALIEHRKASTIAGEGKHIACLQCGDDFGCEAGRDRHIKLAHRERQEIRCPGCGETFERGASLLAHVGSNRCKDQSGLVSQAILSKGRVDAALEMEQLSAMGSAAHFATEHGSVDESVTNGAGGVHISQSLLDRDDEAIDQEIFRNNGNYMDDDDVSVVASASDAFEASSDGTETEAQQSYNRPSISEASRGKEKQPGWGSAMEVWENLSVAGSNKTATTMGWTETLFWDAKPTPVMGGWTQPKAQPSTFRGSRVASDHTAPLSIISGRLIRTDWDHYVFQRDPMGRVMCPFQRCTFTYVDEAAVKTHLISGYHQGTTHQCVKCLRVFKSAVALLSHMESPSTKCNVRDTEQYGHILYMVSGGFIDVNDDERGIRLPDGQLRMRARTKTELAEQQAKREEEQRERERQLLAQW